MSEEPLNPDKLSSLTVVKLKHELETRGLSNKGLKAVLVERLHQYLTSSNNNQNTANSDNTDNNAKPVLSAKKQANEHKQSNKRKKEEPVDSTLSSVNSNNESNSSNKLSNNNSNMPAANTASEDSKHNEKSNKRKKTTHNLEPTTTKPEPQSSPTVNSNNVQSHVKSENKQIQHVKQEDVKMSNTENKAGMKEENSLKPEEPFNDAELYSSSASSSEFPADYISTSCPYLDTINRSMLDFDFEKQCSITLETLNIYCCLICGKYFQGRSTNSQAYFHSINAFHHVFIHLTTKEIYCLPDNYRVSHPSLNDIIYNLLPTFTQQELQQLYTKNMKPVRSLDGNNYYPGLMGLNQIKLNDWFNVIIQLLVRVYPLRDYFLLRDINNPPHTLTQISTLLYPFTELIRKLCNFRGFKSHVSPAVLLKTINTKSNQMFSMEKQTDPIHFLAWLFTELGREFHKTKQKNIVHNCIQGEIEITETKPQTNNNSNENAMVIDNNNNNSSSSSKSSKPFYYLSLALPRIPLFKESSEKSIIPQVSLTQLLSKYDSKTVETTADNTISRTYTITKLPQYLIIHIQRFVRNQFFMEKNPTLVNFPLVGLDLKDYYSGKEANITSEYLKKLSVGELKQLAKQKQISLDNIVEKDEIIKKLLPKTKYNLVANIIHTGEPSAGSYSLYVFNESTNNWYSVENLSITSGDSSTIAGLVSLSEAYIQLYQLQTDE